MPALPLTGSVGRDGVNRPEDVVAVKARLVELGFTWLAPVNPQMNLPTVATIMLFQAIKNGMDVVDRHPNDGLVEVGQGTHLWLRAVNAPRWQRLPLGSRAEGFFNSEVANPPGPNTRHDFGTNWLADTLRGAGAAYRDSFLATHPAAATLTINDASRPMGHNSGQHEGHESGLVCDIRLPNRNGQVGGLVTTSAQYDRAAMRAMLRAFRAQPLFDFAHLNDQQLINEGLCTAAGGHDNHAHVEVKPPPRQDDV